MKGSRGFTLLETIIAVFILSTAATAALTSVRTGARSSEYARDEIVAYYLSNETVEFLRNLRDTNITKGRNWLSGIPVECFTKDNNCRIDTSTKTFEVVDSKEQLRLCFDPNIINQEIAEEESQSTFSSGGYGYDACDSIDVDSGVIQSRFIREIWFEKFDDDNQVVVNIKITWQSGPFKDLSYTVQTLLTDWQ